MVGSGAPAFASSTPTFSKDLVQAGAAPAVAVQATRVTPGLNRPWGLAWLPGGDMLVTERGGTLRRISRDFRLDPQPIEGVPTVKVAGQAGLFDVAVHPDYARNGWIYLAYAEPSPTDDGEYGTALMRARIRDGRLVDQQRLFSMSPKSRRGFHLGGRIVFDGKGHLFLTLGDRGEMARAQRLDDHAGKILRLTDEGKPAPGNPFAGQAGAQPEVFSLGHRNVQGAALHPRSGALWAVEHGPQGGDELNLIRGGANYGWPVITYGVNYVTGSRIGEGTAREGMQQPVRHWTPSPALSGLAFYNGDRFARWRGDLFIGALRGQSLIRVRLDGERAVEDEVLLRGHVARVRDVRAGPDGLLYLLTDHPNGALLRLEPAG